MIRRISRFQRRAAAGCVCGTIFQLSGCSLGEVPLTFTISGEEIALTLIRGAVLDPIDRALTEAVTNFFEDDEDE